MNKSSVIAIIAVFAVALGLPAGVQADAPAFVPIQGFFSDANDNPLEGEHDIRLSLYDTHMGGEPLFQEDQRVLVESGLVVVYLGAIQVLDLSLFKDNHSLFLGIKVDQDSEMTPRFSLGTVPFAGFAQHAGDAQTLQGHPADDFLTTQDRMDWSNLDNVPDAVSDGDDDTLAGLSCAGGQVAQWNGSDWVCASEISDTLAGLFCAGGQVAQWNGSNWVCASGVSDTLAGLSCAGGQVAQWNGSDWVCASEISDTLAGLTCAEGSAVEFIAGAWACALDDTLEAGIGLLRTGLMLSINTWYLDGRYLNTSESNCINSPMIIDGSVGPADLAEAYAPSAHSHDASQITGSLSALQTITGTTGASSSATCPGSKSVLGGGCQGAFGIVISASYPSANTWQCISSGGDLTAYVICADTN